MNQILLTHKKNSKNRKIFLIKLQFIFSFIILFFSLYIFLLGLNEQKSKENISYQLLNHYNISKLYSNTSYINEDTTNPLVLGTISIPKLEITYPIFSICNEELLKIAPCKFFGTNPNEIRKSLHCWP